MKRAVAEGGDAGAGGTTAQDHEWMGLALRLAARGRYTTHPNPRVGAVVVRDGRLAGQGWHVRAGGPHAEVLALRQAGEQAAGSTAYVTLEPCCHFGRTPPCTSALLEAGVRRVVVAMEDPNPLVAGQGLAVLRRAGIEVVSGPLAGEAQKLNRGFVSRMRRARPWVRVKLAAGLDGRTAMASGESKWITGADARRDVQFMRAAADAILTGAGTVLADDPSMNVRLAAADLGIEGDVRQPLRVILDSALRTPPGARVISLPGECLIMTRDSGGARAQALRAAGAQVVPVAAGEGGVDLLAVLEELGRREINEVHVEAGATLAGGLLAAGLADELVLYMAPHLMGDSARGLAHLPRIEAMEQRLACRWEDLRMVGDDLRIILAGPRQRI